MIEKPLELAALIDSMVLFRSVRDGAALSSLRLLLTETGNVNDKVRRYAGFVAALEPGGYDLANAIWDTLMWEGNVYVEARAHDRPIPDVMRRNAARELDILRKISAVTMEELTALTGFSGPLPEYTTRERDYAAEFERAMRDLPRAGFGMYARWNMFRVEQGRVVPVESPDEVRVETLVGYELQRNRLIENTRALMAGLPAANALLVGDAGTGKSSTVKAVANMFAQDGLRLIELKKEQLHDIPALSKELRANPLKFILFVDDLSFNKNDDNFSALKATLEGSANARARNVAIYATSNRRHLVKETFADREGDDVHRNDTMQELLSLSERFGLSILFTRPPKDLYLDIVHGIARRKGIEITDALDVEAAAFALRKGGMSPRAAEQFTDSVLARGGV